MTMNYAHRGASGYFPENTMLSFEKSIDLGATGIETDVQLTKDGVLIIMHDELVDRTTNGHGLIKDYTYKDLRKLDAGFWFGYEYKGLGVPSLEELLEFLQDKDILLNIELKNNIVFYDKLEEKVIDMIYKYNMQNKVILSSFNHYCIKKCKDISKEIPTGALYVAGLYEPEKYAKHLGADAIHPYFYAINDINVIKQVKDSGIKINPYTINDEKYMKFFIENNIDGIITNYPDKLNKLLSCK